jgi:hypothetical protein
MEGRIKTSSAMGGLSPRASINEISHRIDKGGYGITQMDYEFLSVPVSALFSVWRPWRIDECVSNWLLSAFWSVYSPGLGTFWLAFNTMPRKRGTPRRGSAWYASKEQRLKKEQLERALAIATALMRKRARAEEAALLSTIAEQGGGCSSMNTTTLEGSNEELYPACIVEEDPTLADLPPMELMSEIGSLRGEDCNFAPGGDAFPPACIVEEIPRPELDDAVDAGIATAKEGCWEDGQHYARSEDVGGGVHGPLLREEHLSLVFEIRSHLADLEYRASLMSQRLHVLLDAYSGAPARRKCPCCAQYFAFPAGPTDDRSPVT